MATRLGSALLFNSSCTIDSCPFSAASVRGLGNHTVVEKTNQNMENTYIVNDTEGSKIEAWLIKHVNMYVFIFSLAHFYSFLMNSSTDAGNVEDEVIVIIHSARNRATQEIISCTRFFFQFESLKMVKLLRRLVSG